jgi:hypothetical protein
MNKFITGTMAAVLLSACASMGGQPLTQLQKIELGCTSASTAIKALTVARRAGKLTPLQVGKVTQAGVFLAPICMAESPPTLNFLQEAAFEEAVKMLVAEGSRYGR